MKFTKFFSSDLEASSKRLIAVVLVAVFIIQYFLLMYIKVEIANRELVKENQWYLFLLILIFGGYIVADGILAFLKTKAEVRANADIKTAEAGIPKNVVVQQVDQQNVNTEETEEKEPK